MEITERAIELAERIVTRSVPRFHLSGHGLYRTKLKSVRNYTRGRNNCSIVIMDFTFNDFQIHAVEGVGISHCQDPDVINDQAGVEIAFTKAITDAVRNCANLIKDLKE